MATYLIAHALLTNVQVVAFGLIAVEIIVTWVERSHCVSTPRETINYPSSTWGGIAGRGAAGPTLGRSTLRFFVRAQSRSVDQAGAGARQPRERMVPSGFDLCLVMHVQQLCQLTFPNI
eukprot:6181838-Pleurochrysis_carterae.AAC.2